MKKKRKKIGECIETCSVKIFYFILSKKEDNIKPHREFSGLYFVFLLVPQGKKAPLSGLRDLKRANMLHHDRVDASVPSKIFLSRNINPHR